MVDRATDIGKKTDWVRHWIKMLKEKVTLIYVQMSLIFDLYWDKSF